VGGVSGVDVNMVFDSPWMLDRMSEEVPALLAPVSTVLLES
jgi:metal-sulfur cluster biosynthetic enzyme